MNDLVGQAREAQPRSQYASSAPCSAASSPDGSGGTVTDGSGACRPNDGEANIAEPENRLETPGVRNARPTEALTSRPFAEILHAEAMARRQEEAMWAELGLPRVCNDEAVRAALPTDDAGFSALGLRLWGLDLVRRHASDPPRDSDGPQVCAAPSRVYAAADLTPCNGLLWMNNAQHGAGADGLVAARVALLRACAQAAAQPRVKHTGEKN